MKPLFSRLLLGLSLLLAAPALHAQACTPTATQACVSGTIRLPSGAGAGHSAMRFELMNCGGNAGSIPGVGTIVDSPFDVQTTVGAWSTPVYGDDVIGCGAAQPGATLWRITPFINGAGGTAVTYRIQSNTSFVVDGAPACATPTSYNCATDYLPACGQSCNNGGIPGGPTGPTGSGTSNTIPMWSGVGGASTVLTDSPMALSTPSQQIIISNEGLSVAGAVTFVSRFGSYNGVTNSGTNGMTHPIRATSGSFFHANYGPVVFYTPSASNSQANYRLSCYLVVMTPASTSSTLPSCQVSWTDFQTNVVETATFSTPSTGNVLGTFNQGSIYITPAFSTPISISTTGYASVGSMYYFVNFELERF